MVRVKAKNERVDLIFSQFLDRKSRTTGMNKRQLTETIGKNFLGFDLAGNRLPKGKRPRIIFQIDLEK